MTDSVDRDMGFGVMRRPGTVISCSRGANPLMQITCMRSAAAATANRVVGLYPEAMTFSRSPRSEARLARSDVLVALLVLKACGGDGGGGDTPPTAPPVPGPPVLGVASGAPPVAAGCTGVASGAPASGGIKFANAEVEPFAAIHLGNPNLLLVARLRSRRSNGGARALVSAVSSDGGVTCTRTLHPMSRCGGAGTGMRGEFERAPDLWVDIGPDGTLHMMRLAYNGSPLLAGSASAMLASRSIDNDHTWSTPAVLASAGAGFFRDKDTLAADNLEA